MRVVSGDLLAFNELPGRLSADPLRGLATVSSVRIVRPQRAEQRLAHRHPHSEEVTYVVAGRGVVYIDGVWHVVRPRDIVHIPPGATHATVPEDGGEMELICFFPHPNLSDNIEETDIDVMTVQMSEPDE